MEKTKIKSISFREKRKRSWRKLERLLTKIDQQGIKSLSADEVLELAQLYRTACSSLYIARTVSLDRNLHDYLENLVTQGYLTIYCTKPVVEHPIRDFFLRDFPQVIRKYFYYHLAVFLLLLFGILVGFFLTSYDNNYFYTFVDRELAAGRTPYASKESLDEALTSGRDSGYSELTYFSSMLFTHNTKVGLYAFGLGIFLALPTLYLMFLNGGMLGAMSYVYHSHGLQEGWWAWILAHGVTEFLAIILCGGAGLMIGSAVVYPGKYGRMHRLKEMGRDSGITVLGTVVLFFVAGVIEGYFRQSHLPNGPRYLLALITFVFWLFYFGFVGKENRVWNPDPITE